MYYAYITRLIPEEVKDMQFDYVILGEMLEHVNDPVFFLRNIKEKLKSNVSKIIITVPNALRFRRVFDRFYNRGNRINEEYINSDHRYWFTPYTIAKVCMQSGIYPEKLFFCDSLSRIAIIREKLGMKTNSFLGNTLVLAGLLK